MIVVEFEFEFMRLNCYASGMVATEQNKSLRFEDMLTYDMKIQVTPHQERVFETVVKKTKIVEEIKRLEREKRDKNKVQIKRDFGSTGSISYPLKQARKGKPQQSNVVIGTGGKNSNYAYGGKQHPSECGRKMGACLRCGSTKHRIKKCPCRIN
ncbi:hypothetical protein V6Z11_D04G136400 [Gossypium hirsutum]